MMMRRSPYPESCLWERRKNAEKIRSCVRSTTSKCFDEGDTISHQKIPPRNLSRVNLDRKKCVFLAAKTRSQATQGRKAVRDA